MVAFALDPLKSRIDCRDLYQSLVGSGKRSGKAWVDKTPWRDDRKPSLNVYADGWLDRATGDGGDVYSLVMNLHNFDFKQAKAFVEAWAGVTPADYPRPVVIQRPAPVSKNFDTPPAAEWQKAALQAVFAAQGYLWSDRPDARAALAYLQGRGLSDETIRAASLGYNRDWFKTGWIKDDGKPAYLVPGIVIPHVVGGELLKVAVRARVGALAEALGIPEDTDRDSEPLQKYCQLAGGCATLYNADAIHPGQPVLLSEGEFDCLIAEQVLGDRIAVVTLGSASNGLAQRWRDVLAAAPIILGALDNDEAGAKGKARLLAELPNLRPVAVPSGKDITDFVLSGGNLAAWIDAELNKPLPESSARAENVAALAWLPYSVEQIWNEYDPKHAPAALTLLRAIVEYAPDGQPFDLPGLAKASGTDYRQLHRALSYGVSKLLEEAAPAEANVRCVHSILLSKNDQEDTKCSSDICSSLSGKTKHYQLPANWLDRLPEVLTLGAIEKVAKHRLSPKFKRADTQDYKTIWTNDGQPYELTAVDEVNARLVAEIPQDMQQAVDDEIASIRQRLSVKRGASLPELWKTDYRAALVDRAERPYIDASRPRYKVQAETGLSRAAQRSGERRIGFKPEPQLHPEGQLVEKVDDLPDLVWTPEYRGFPASATFDNGDNLNYQSREKRKEIAHRIRQGERCRIDYNQTPIIREMTPEERAAQTAKKARRPATELVTPAAPENQQQQAEIAAEKAYQSAVEVVRWTLDYLGYRSRNGATYDCNGELIADAPLSALSGSSLITLARGKTLITIEEPISPVGETAAPAELGKFFPKIDTPELCLAKVERIVQPAAPLSTVQLQQPVAEAKTLSLDNVHPLPDYKASFFRDSLIQTALSAKAVREADRPVLYCLPRPR